MIPTMLLVGFVAGRLGRRWDRQQAALAVMVVSALVWGVGVGRESIVMALGGAALGAINLAVGYVAALPWSTKARDKKKTSTDQPSPTSS